MINLEIFILDIIHKPSDICFLSLEGINSKTNLTMINKNILNNDLKNELEI